MNQKNKIPDFSKEGKKPSYLEVPENYFSSFNDRLRERLDDTNTEKPEQESGHRRIPLAAWIGSAAAALIGIYFIGYGWLKSPDEIHFSQEEIALVLEEELFDLDAYDIEMEYTAIQMNEEGETNSGTSPYEEEVIQYLLDEEIELTDIINEL